MDRLLSRVVVDLQERYSPHTIILYGSRARGDCTPSSDIDIVCFVESTTAIQTSTSLDLKDARDFEGLYLDAWVYSSDAISASTDDLLRVADGYCLYDAQGWGEAFLKELQKRIQEGPKPLSASEIQHTKQWVNKMVERAKNLDIESLYRRYWLAVDLLQIYFDLRGQWYFGPKKSLAWLREHDSIGYKLFSQVYDRSMRFEDLDKLAEYVTDT
jgi:predicted nucleotidyltransferase